MNFTITINNRRIGPGKPVYIIAEMSANHNQDFHQAVRILQAARDAGADAVKLQTYTADTMTIDCDSQDFQIKKGTIWEGKNLYDLYQEAHTPWEWQAKLSDVADDLGIDLFSTPFDNTAVDFLEDLDVPAYKIASFELVDLPLIRRVAQTGKPIIMSTGMASLGEIEDAVHTIQGAGNLNLVLLKCTSAYPAPPQEINLRTIPHLGGCFNVPAGLSDHTMGSAVSIAAVALGACVIEKHLTISRNTPGPDSRFSMEPHEFKEMVTAIRMTEKALGRVCYGTGKAESECHGFRRSLYAVEDVKKGDMFTDKNVRSIRPGYGLAPKYIEDILTRRSTCDVKRGTPLSWDLLLGEKT